jgi:hypothetical protein
MRTQEACHQPHFLEADSGSFCRIHIDEYGAYQTSDDLADVEMRYHQMQRAEIEPCLGWDFTP